MMKLLLVVLLVALTVLPVSALADPIDISGLSFDELVELQERINLALWDADEWQEVTVPPGIYEIGKDIPAGVWNIKAAEGLRSFLSWGKGIDPSLSRIADYVADDRVTSISSENFDPNTSLVSVDWNLTSGDFLEIINCAAVFSPSTGEKSFSFK